MPIRNLTVYDILAISIPGATFLLLCFPLLIVILNIPQTTEYMNVPVGDTTLSIALLIFSYLFGSLFQGIAERTITGVERRYDRFINTSLYTTEEFNKPFNAQLVRRFQKGDGDRIIKKCEEVFGTKFSKIDDSGNKSIDRSKLGRLYWLIQSYLFTRGIERAQRWSLLEKFFRGIWVAFLIVSIVNLSVILIALVLTISGYFPDVLGVLLGVICSGIIAFAIVGSVVSHQERRKYARYWGSALIDDFMTNTMIDQQSCPPQPPDEE